MRRRIGVAAVSAKCVLQIHAKCYKLNCTCGCHRCVVPMRKRGVTVMLKFRELRVGNNYEVRHTRQGTYIGKCMRVDGEWATFEIVEGRAIFRTEPDRVAGEQVTARESLCRVYPTQIGAK